MITTDLTGVDPELAAAAISGPWQAQALDAAGRETRITEDITLIRVARTNGIWSRATNPGESLHENVAYQIDTFYSDQDVRDRWLQAQAMAAGLNAAAMETAR